MAALPLVACHNSEQKVVGVAQQAVGKAEDAVSKAEAAANQAKAAAAEGNAQRAALAAIALPTKSHYKGVRTPESWQNPFLVVGEEKILLRVKLPGEGRPQESEVLPQELGKALVALPPGAWRYGRVAAVAESRESDRQSLAQVRRNMEAAMQRLYDLGVVVEEWPTK